MVKRESRPGRLNLPWLAAAVAAVCLLCIAQSAFAGSLVGWGDNRYGQATPPAGADFIAIAAGGYHGLALKQDGSIVGWGRNDDGQASPPAGNTYIAIAAGMDYGLALTVGRSGSTPIVGWGLNQYGQATPPSGNDFVAIAAGNDHGLALKYTCMYLLAGDLNDDCKVDFADCAVISADWLIDADLLDFAIMAENWLIDCDLTPADPACIPK